MHQFVNTVACKASENSTKFVLCDHNLVILIAINFILKKQQLIGNHAEILRFLLSNGSLLPLTVARGWGGRMHGGFRETRRYASFIIEEREVNYETHYHLPILIAEQDTATSSEWKQLLIPNPLCEQEDSMRADEVQSTLSSQILPEPWLYL